MPPACPHIGAIADGQVATPPGVRGVRRDRCRVGASAHLPGVRRDAVLRLVAEPSRQQARARQPARGDRVRGARRALVVLLRRRGIRAILDCPCTSPTWFAVRTEHSIRATRAIPTSGKKRTTPDAARITPRAGGRSGLVYFEAFETRGDALRREHGLKRLSRPQKQALIKDGGFASSGSRGDG